MDKPVRNFLETAIRSLSKEEFDEAVAIFQRCYLHNEPVNVDGVNDGGSDIKIFQGKREIKKCVQVTINKSIENKLKTDLVKVDKKITDFGYSNNFDFFCNTVISDSKVDEMKKFALETYDINLNIYEAQRLSQLDCREFTDYIYSLHKDVVINPRDLSVDKATKVLYDLLATGKDSADIKNSLYHSVLLSVLYENQSMKEEDLKKEVEKRLHKSLPDFHSTISSLRSSGQIVNDKSVDKHICLCQTENDNIKDIIATSLQLENDFVQSLADILQVEKDDVVVQKTTEILKKLYRQYYKIDIDDTTEVQNVSDNRSKIFAEFSKSLKSLLPDKERYDVVLEQIKQLCVDNTYLNRIAASESVLSLYHSDKLSSYLSQKEKKIYLDTPSFVYLLCGYFYGTEVTNDWNDSLYRSMKSLMKQSDVSNGKVTFYIMSSYLSEVANELKKALQISWIGACPFATDLGETTNTFYNYYCYMKEHELFESEDKIDTFEDFIYRMGFDDFDTNNQSFTTNTLKTLNTLSEDYGVTVEPFRIFDNFSSIRDGYEKMLFLKNKTKTRPAANKDTEQTLFLLMRNQYVSYAENTDWFFATWDSSIVLLRNDLLDKDTGNLYNYYTISNPAQLSNRFAIENFDIDNSAITNDIFVYADRNFDISNKVRNLIDIIAPILGNKGKMNHKLINALSRTRKEQLEDKNRDVSGAKSSNLPIEDALIYLFPKTDGADNYQEKMSKFAEFMNAEENSDYIMKTLSNIINSQSKHIEYDLTEFNGKVYGASSGEESEMKSEAIPLNDK